MLAAIGPESVRVAAKSEVTEVAPEEMIGGQTSDLRIIVGDEREQTVEAICEQFDGGMPERCRRSARRFSSM